MATQGDGTQKKQFVLRQNPLIDIHTHMYPPPYISILKSRTTVPYIRSTSANPDDLRLIILPGLIHE